MFEIICPHNPCCSGSIPPAILSEAEAYFAQLDVPFKFITGKTQGWRIRSKLAIRGTSAKPMIGLFQEGTHDIIDIPNCRMHHPKINEASQLLREWIIDCAIEPYDELKGTGDIRYAQFVVERSTGKVQLTLVFNILNVDQALAHKLDLLWKKTPKLWHSLWFNGNKLKTNTIFGDVWRLFHGSEWLWESILGRRVCFKPSSFGQANLEAFENLLSNVKTNISRNKRIVEFYAGIGIIGMCLLDISKKVICAEINPFSKDCFDNSIEGFSDEERFKISYRIGPASSHIELINQSDIVLVDPPRKGLDKTLLKSLSEATNIKELVYISCGWESFKRDCDRLLEKKWKLDVVEAYLFFPGSNHLETMAIFKRA